MNVCMIFEFGWGDQKRKSDDDVELLKNYQKAESFYNRSPVIQGELLLI